MSTVLVSVGTLVNRLSAVPGSASRKDGGGRQRGRSFSSGGSGHSKQVSLGLNNILCVRGRASLDIAVVVGRGVGVGKVDNVGDGASQGTGGQSDGAGHSAVRSLNSLDRVVDKLVNRGLGLNGLAGTVGNGDEVGNG